MKILRFIQDSGQQYWPFVAFSLVAVFVASAMRADQFPSRYGQQSSEKQKHFKEKDMIWNKPNQKYALACLECVRFASNGTAVA